MNRNELRLAREKVPMCTMKLHGFLQPLHAIFVKEFKTTT
jgi:hypothetical protein